MNESTRSKISFTTSVSGILAAVIYHLNPQLVVFFFVAVIFLTWNVTQLLRGYIRWADKPRRTYRKISRTSRKNP